jgi:hypothetical protein
VERESRPRPMVDEPEGELEGASFGSAVATAAIATAACLLARLPAVTALRFLQLPVGWVGAGLGCLGAAMGGVKLTAMAWAVGGRFPARPPARAAVAGAD